MFCVTMWLRKTCALLLYLQSFRFFSTTHVRAVKFALVLLTEGCKFAFQLCLVRLLDLPWHECRGFLKHVTRCRSPLTVKTINLLDSRSDWPSALRRCENLPASDNTRGTSRLFQYCPTQTFCQRFHAFLYSSDFARSKAACRALHHFVTSGEYT